jgi:hypothetical protein
MPRVVIHVSRDGRAEDREDEDEPGSRTPASHFLIPFSGRENALARLYQANSSLPRQHSGG